MQRAIVTIKNYRCFQDTNPLKLEMGPGFTALVGPNNSGKSSCIKLFHELYELWANLLSCNTLTTLIRGGTIGISYRDVYDSREIFCDINVRPLSIEIELPDRPELHKQNEITGSITKVRLECDQASPGNWQAYFYEGQDHQLIARNEDASFMYSLRAVFGGPAGRRIAEASNFEEWVRAIHNCLYIAPYRNAISEGSATYFGMNIGNAFIATWNQWKTGNEKAQNLLANKVTEDIRRIFDFQKLEINASQDVKTLALTIDGKPYKLRELGAGIAQFILVLGNVAMRKPTLLLIDEPELNLHPTLQADFLTTLAAYTTDGVIYATHSLGLARATADRIYSFQKHGHTSITRIFEQTPNYVEFVGELSFGGYRELGFDRILLVEGSTEVRTIQQFLRLLGKEHKTVVLPLGGSQLINGRTAHELNEIARISKNVSVLIDSEKVGKEAEPLKDRKDFADVCVALGFRVHLTKFRATENYLNDRAIRIVKGEKYSALEPYQRLRDHDPSWDKAENWRIAREMTKTELLATDVGQFLEEI